MGAGGNRQPVDVNYAGVLQDKYTALFNTPAVNNCSSVYHTSNSSSPENKFCFLMNCQNLAWGDSCFARRWTAARSRDWVANQSARKPLSIDLVGYILKYVPHRLHWLSSLWHQGAVTRCVKTCLPWASCRTRDESWNFGPLATLPAALLWSFLFPRNCKGKNE